MTKPPGALAVEFTHTSTPEREKLPDYSALLAWAEEQGVVTPGLGRQLAAEARDHPGRAARVHADAVSLRDSLYRVLKAAGDAAPVDEDDVDVLNAMLRRAAKHRQLAEGPHGFEWQLEEPGGDALDSPLWPVAQSAAELLTSGWVDRIGVCSSDSCRWLFIDESRNRSRRWCDMADCGTREKVRRFRARAKKEAEAAQRPRTTPER